MVEDTSIAGRCKLDIIMEMNKTIEKQLITQASKGRGWKEKIKSKK